MIKINPRRRKEILIANLFINTFFKTKQENRDIDWIKIKKILVIDFKGIGDLTMLTVFLKILKFNSPNAEITLCCNFYGKSLLEDQGIVNVFYCINGLKYINSPRRLLFKPPLLKKYINEINENSIYDVAIEPRGDLRYIYFMSMIKAKRKISYDYTGGEGLLTDIIKHSDTVTHLVEDKIYLLRKLGCKIKDGDIYPELTITKKSQKQNEEFINSNHLENKTIIGVHPGAREINRQWDKYPELIEKIVSSYPDCAILVFSDGTVEDIVNSIKSKNAAYKSLVMVKETFEVYKRVLAICDFFITNDSGAGHLAAAYGIPEVVVFGPANPVNVMPYGKNRIICVSHNIDCKPCYSKVCINGSYKCLKSISMLEIFNAFQNLYEG